MFEFYSKLNCNFTESEKEECKPIIYRIIDLASIARQKSLLALELEMEDEESFFLKTAISLVVDGIDPASIKQILQSVILADGYSGSQLLGGLLMAEGVLLLQQGENPRMMAMKLSAMLGENYISQIDGLISAMRNKMSSYYQFLKTVKCKKPIPESAQFESKLFQMDAWSIQLVLRSTDYLCLLSALHGCGYALIQKLFENTSTNTCLMLVGEWELMKIPDKEYIIRCQKEILDKIAVFENRGDIIDFSRFIFEK